MMHVRQTNISLSRLANVTWGFDQVLSMHSTYRNLPAHMTIPPESVTPQLGFKTGHSTRGMIAHHKLYWAQRLGSSRIWPKAYI